MNNIQTLKLSTCTFFYMLCALKTNMMLGVKCGSSSANNNKNQGIHDPTHGFDIIAKQLVFFCFDCNDLQWDSLVAIFQFNELHGETRIDVG